MWQCHMKSSRKRACRQIGVDTIRHSQAGVGMRVGALSLLRWLEILSTTLLSHISTRRLGPRAGLSEHYSRLARVVKEVYTDAGIPQPSQNQVEAPVQVEAEKSGLSLAVSSIDIQRHYAQDQPWLEMDCMGPSSLLSSVQKPEEVLVYLHPGAVYVRRVLGSFGGFEWLQKKFGGGGKLSQAAVEL
ncbi:hypothetical protein K440DRAFT_251011 [Wilcoxina mikolae CBS 423.85]|nr:hypothetical protein K440DRAFT_251011 [Wilcoxina mikolae CBS 423.85]